MIVFKYQYIHSLGRAPQLYRLPCAEERRSKPTRVLDQEAAKSKLAHLRFGGHLMCSGYLIGTLVSWLYVATAVNLNPQGEVHRYPGRVAPSGP
jgi:hypothetical protein